MTIYCQQKFWNSIMNYKWQWLKGIIQMSFKISTYRFSSSSLKGSDPCWKGDSLPYRFRNSSKMALALGGRLSPCPCSEDGSSTLTFCGEIFSSWLGACLTRTTGRPSSKGLFDSFGVLGDGALTGSGRLSIILVKKLTFGPPLAKVKISPSLR